MYLIKNRPLAVVIRWQLVCALLVAIGCGFLGGAHGAISGFLGAGVSALSAAAYALMVSRHRGYSASDALRTALRAEAIKIILIIVALWGVFTSYEEVRPVMFIGSFLVAVIISSMAIFVSEESQAEKRVQK